MRESKKKHNFLKILFFNIYLCLESKHLIQNKLNTNFELTAPYTFNNF